MDNTPIFQIPCEDRCVDPQTWTFPYVLETGFWTHLVHPITWKNHPRIIMVFHKHQVVGPFRNGRTHSMAYGTGMILTIFTILWHWMIPTQPGEDANLSKLLLMPMSMDGDIVCFTGYLDLRIFCPQNRGKSFLQKHGSTKLELFFVWLLHGSTQVVVRAVALLSAMIIS